jgi:hypothetical protein
VHLAPRRRGVVDDVVHRAGCGVERGDGRGRRVVDVHEGQLAAPVRRHRRNRAATAIQEPVAQSDAPEGAGLLLVALQRPEDRVDLSAGTLAERGILVEHALAEVVEAVSVEDGGGDESRGPGGLGHREKRARALHAQPIGGAHVRVAPGSTLEVGRLVDDRVELESGDRVEHPGAVEQVGDDALHAELRGDRGATGKCRHGVAGARQEG